ncbi:MAG TPA: hypothetical protein DC042_07445 [Bacteroidales bacterium]|nr:hypothetical protein [Bacteroidales bacterium]
MNQTERKLILAATASIEKILGGGIPIINLTEGQDQTISPELKQFTQTLQNLIDQYLEGYRFVLALSKGILDQEPPKGNQFVSSFKQLHSDLLHLTWQTQRIAGGDYNQKVSFMGDFSLAFNQMIDSLRQKQIIENELMEREKRLNEKTGELMAINQMKDKLFSIIAHDLRGPIGNTGNLVRLLIDGDISDPDEVKKALKMVYASSESIYLLLENLLAWSDSRRKEIPYNPMSGNLTPLFQETVDLYSGAIQMKNIDFEINAEPVTMAFFDTAMIQTILRNLFSNAMKFTPPGGKITIGARKTGNQVLVFVKDTGIGMTEEILHSLFADKSGASREGTNKEKGHGLGLVLCKEMIARHGDDLAVASKVNEGSTFSFRLPAEAPA